MHWFLSLFAEGAVDGLYFALPTRVAARELFSRVSGWVRRTFPDTTLRPPVVLAVPGYGQPSEAAEEASLADPESRCEDDDDARLRERTWAAEHPKRFLAATVAVGTVDQALLSAVQTAHAHLRSVCLDRSLLVVDEVHASDTYMRALLEALLRHHLRVGGYAMLLSATLGASARSALVAAAGGPEVTPTRLEAEAFPYPAVSLRDGKILAAASPGASPPREVAFDLLPHAFDLKAVTPRVVEALRHGARVLVVLNTVRRAVAFQRALETATAGEEHVLFRCHGMVCPHHGRFAPADRLVLDPAVGQRFGKGAAPGPVALVGTQTLEQSLDIDADVLVTDLCPADVLLQRVGRLHRHHRTDRPSPFRSPRCLVLVPNAESLEHGLDDRGEPISQYRRAGWGSVYEDLRILELTRRALLKKRTVILPADNRRLVEAATHPEALSSLAGDRWTQHGNHVSGADAARRVAASLATGSGLPRTDSTIFDLPFGEFDWNDAGKQVMTRLGVDSLRLPLNRAVTSPFGQPVTDVVIPGHLRPAKPAEKVTVVEQRGEAIVLRCAERTYSYSRFGLEEVSGESADR